MVIALDNLYVVYDQDDDDSSKPHLQPPSCILAGMNAKIDIFGNHGLSSSRYDLFPNGTTAANFTCGRPGEQEQKLVLNWQPDSEVVFFFRQQNVSLDLINGFWKKSAPYFTI